MLRHKLIMEMNHLALGQLLTRQAECWLVNWFWFKCTWLTSHLALLLLLPSLLILLLIVLVPDQQIQLSHNGLLTLSLLLLGIPLLNL
jgi:hypothetical protein